MSWLHTWVGLTLSWVLYFIFITGTAGYFDTEIDRWMQPEIPMFDYTEDQLQKFNIAKKYVDQNAPNVQHWYVSFPSERFRHMNVGWYNEQQDIYEEDTLNPLSGEKLVPRRTGGGQLLYEMHYELHYLPGLLAVWIVSICTMFMFVALISGIIVHKKIFKEFFTFRLGKGQRSWLDVHNLLSVLSLPFLLMITYSGLLFYMYTTMPVINQISSDRTQDNSEKISYSEVTVSPVTVRPVPPLDFFIQDAVQHWGDGGLAWIEVDEPTKPNAVITIAQASQLSRFVEEPRLRYDRLTGELLNEKTMGNNASEQFFNVIANLHLGLFANSLLRWGYFLSGLLGAGMVGTGLILWSVKRKAAAEKSGKPHKGLALVERLNVGTIVGLPIAIAVYFSANRLIPVSFEGRAEWEVHALFITWGLTLVYPVFRSVQRSWIELLGFATLLYILLPFLNFLTTERHLGISLPQGDWVMAGFDLTMLVFGGVFFLAMRRMQKREIMMIVPGSVNSNSPENNTNTIEIVS